MHNLHRFELPFVELGKRFNANKIINEWIFNPGILLGGLVSELGRTGAFETVKNIIKKKDKIDSDVN